MPATDRIALPTGVDAGGSRIRALLARSDPVSGALSLIMCFMEASAP